MNYELITSRNVIGMFFQALQQNPGLGWVLAISMYFKSDQALEEYGWLGNAPVLRRWVGGRRATGFRENGFKVENLDFEATIEIKVKDLRRDKTTQIRVRINDLVERTNTHWASLLSTLIADGEQQLCYDESYFFDTTHEEGKSGVQSNLIDVDISELPVELHGTITSPSVAEMQQAVAQAITQIVSFKDDQGEPMNEAATEFMVMVPPSMHVVAQQAFEKHLGVALEQRDLNNYKVNVVVNPRLSSWTSNFVVFRTDGSVSPFIRQEEGGINLGAKAEGSEFEFDHKKHQYGVDTSRNVACGYWQYACKVNLI